MIFHIQWLGSLSLSAPIYATQKLYRDLDLDISIDNKSAFYFYAKKLFIIQTLPISYSKTIIINYCYSIKILYLLFPH